MVQNHGFYKPQLGPNNKPLPAGDRYDVTTLTLGQLIFVMTNYCMSFEQIREMTLAQVSETFERINVGEILTWEQVRQEQKAKREKK